MKQRDSRFELMRIIAMCMIVISHYSLYGNWQNIDEMQALETTRILSLDALGPIGAVIFFMITGYFYSVKDFENKRLKTFSKVKKVWLKTWCYSTLMLIVSVYLKVGIDTNMLIKSVFPVVMNEYWFITCYILLMLLIPYIDIVLEILTKRQLQQLLILFLILMVVQLVNSEIINRLMLALYAYCVGYYIKKHNNELKKMNKTFLINTLLAIFFVDVLSIYVSRKLGISFAHSAHFTQFVLPIFIGGGILIGITKFKPFKSNIINLYASSVLPIYLITENSAFRNYLWSKLFNVGQYQTSQFFYLIAIGITLIVCLLCASFDIVVSFVIRAIKKVNMKVDCNK